MTQYVPQPYPLFLAAYDPDQAGPVVYRVVGWSGVDAETAQPVVVSTGSRFCPAARVLFHDHRRKTYAYAETAEHAMCAVSAPTWSRDEDDK